VMCGRTAGESDDDPRTIIGMPRPGLHWRGVGD
jgi:hypothetical protein